MGQRVKTKAIIVRLEPEFYEQVRIRAAERHTNISALLRKGLRSWLEATDPPAEVEPRLKP